MEETKLFDRIKGGLYGVAVGDALGGTTEFLSTAEVKFQYGYLTEIIGGGVWKLEPGEVTDDTMMTLCVADGILEQPEDPREAIGRYFLAWFKSQPKDIGNIIRYVLETYEGEWFTAAYIADLDLGRSAGNGSLMRCLPVALAYPELAQMEQVTHVQSKMTHYDQLCSDACLIYNRIAARLLQGEELKASVAAEITGTPYEEMLHGEPDCEPSGYVVHTFRWVLHILLHAADFSDAVQRAANLGGDSDTIGAIAGGLAGIYAGYSAIPARYSQVLLVQERLDDVSQRLYELRMSKS